jgi:hypothetical protein
MLKMRLNMKNGQIKYPSNKKVEFQSQADPIMAFQGCQVQPLATWAEARKKKTLLRPKISV